MFLEFASKILVMLLQKNLGKRLSFYLVRINNFYNLPLWRIAVKEISLKGVFSGGNI